MSNLHAVSVSATPSYASVTTQTQAPLKPLVQLDLTEAQRTQLRAIFTNAHKTGISPSVVEQQVKGVLTPAQQTQLKALRDAEGLNHPRQRPEPVTLPQATGAASASTPVSTSAQTNATVSNVQNQSAAAQSTLLNTLESVVRSS